MSYFSKFKGQNQALPQRPNLRAVAFVWGGSLIAAMVIGFLAFYSQQPLIMGSFGATCFILFVLPASPFAQPRNVIGGHFISTLAGLAFFHFVSPDWWSMALALATAIALMQLLNVPHPPAGSNPFIVFLASAPWSFLFIPTLIGAVLLVIIALLYNNLAKDKHYPSYWF